MAEDDIISTLPDPILCHILSFLETKQSVATSILSKRWNPLWRSVTSMRFNTKVTNQISNVDFIDFVYSVLLSRDAAVPINTFHLELMYSDVKCPIKSIAKWLNFVLQNGVKHLYFHVTSVPGLLELPITILNSKTLVVLKLFCVNLERGFSSVQLPSLKTLHLDDVWFSKIRDFMMFLTGFPILEDLLTQVFFVSEESLTCNEWKSFCLSNLTRADIDCFFNYFPLKAVHNVPSLRLKFNQEYYHNDMIPVFHNLTQLELISYDYGWEFLLEVLTHCPKLQRLDLDEVEIDEEICAKKKDDKKYWMDLDVVPQCLSLHLRTCNLSSFLGLQGELMLVRYILKNARVLQTMKIWNNGNPKVKRVLSSFPRASSTCKLTVYHDPCDDYNEFIPSTKPSSGTKPKRGS